MKDKIIEIENISKIYRLGETGARTIRADFQSFLARIMHKEDPNTKIGAAKHVKGDMFTALDNVSFDIYRGETVGIIGRNGAGKSTLLKILSRITAPTSGTIRLRGRVSSMLEIGTGFHPELTGRENIYLNGAILGMSRHEVDARLSDIIAFSECERFIDTPIKRYSSGMYVKLAFAVAAHLDSEILIMDEVLAVGDMNFQRKCIEKMRSVAENEGRTILYVSHNMDTVKNLCTRTVLLENGTVAFDGDTESAVEAYLGNSEQAASYMEFREADRARITRNKHIVRLNSALYPSGSVSVGSGEKLRLQLNWSYLADVENLCVRLTVYDSTMRSAATSVICGFCSGKSGENASAVFDFDMDLLASGRYETRYTFFLLNGAREDIESFMGLPFYKAPDTLNSKISWRSGVWGSVILPSPQISEKNF